MTALIRTCLLTGHPRQATSLKRLVLTVLSADCAVASRRRVLIQHRCLHPASGSLAAVCGMLVLESHPCLTALSTNNNSRRDQQWPAFGSNLRRPRRTSVQSADRLQFCSERSLTFVDACQRQCHLCFEGVVDAESL